MKEQEK